MQSFGLNYKRENFQLLIDVAKASQKGLLLHTGNLFQSVSVFDAVQMNGVI
jgi:hypothetical protein